MKTGSPSTTSVLTKGSQASSREDLNTFDADNLEPAVASAVKKDGMLGRRGGTEDGLEKAYKNTWVEFANNMLYFYKDTQAKKKDGKKDKPFNILELKNCRIDCSGSMDKKRCIFAVTTHEGVAVLLQAPSEADAQAWSDLILEVMGARQEVFNEAKYKEK